MKFLLLLVMTAHTTLAASVELAFRHVVAGEPLQLGSLRYDTGAGETFSVTRLSYLLSGFAFQREDGSWLELADSVAWLDAEKGRTSLRLEVPDDVYRATRFHVGPDAPLNHADAARFAAGHPLNPNLNGLHWNWQGGYVFLALEGLWRQRGPFDGWSFHLARDTNRVRIHIAGPLALTNDSRIDLDFDLAPLLNAPRPLSFTKDGSSTHSREGDPITAALAANLPGAFRVRRVVVGELAPAAPAPGTPPCLPAKFTPYRFAMSATFPMPELPRDNPLIEERIALGEALFHEAMLSRNRLLSCASCHEAEAAYTDRRRYSVGVQGRTGTRNAMPLFNLAWRSSFFWDGRAPSLRAQVLMPIQDHAEMDETLTNVVAKLQSCGGSPCGDAPAQLTIRHSSTDLGNQNLPALAATNPVDYPALFARAFGSQEITSEKISLALEQFLLTLTSFDSRFDRAMKGETKLSGPEQRGFELFMTEYDPRRGQFGADCFHCHGGPLFQSQSFANNGLDAEFNDPGRMVVTGRPGDRGKFAVPSLRNVALTAPYMHDGRFATLEEVITHYASGVQRSATLDPNLAKHPDGGVPLSASDRDALAAFLKTLTDERFTTNRVRLAQSP